MKRILTMLVALAMVFATATIFVTPVSAARRGTTGDCNWFLDDNGVLTISGDGYMELNYEDEGLPWGNNIKEVIIEEGVISISSYAFYECYNLSKVTIPNSVKFIGGHVFCYTDISSIVFPDNISFFDSDMDMVICECDNIHTVTLPFEPHSTQPFTGKYYPFNDTLFYDCKNLTSAIIPEGVKKIEYRPFVCCDNLENIYIHSPEIARDLIDEEACGEIAKNAEKIYVKEGITEISDFITSMNYKTEGVVVNGVIYTLYSLTAPHVCTYKWKKDSTSHWQVCEECDYVGEEADHTYDNGEVTTEPTVHSTGKKTFTCTVCGATKTEVIPKLDAPANNGTEDSEAVKVVVKNNTTTVVIVAIVASIISAAVSAAVVTVIYKKKK